MKAIREIFLSLLALVCLSTNAFSNKMIPTHLSKITISYDQYEMVTSKFDAVMRRLGFSRYGAAPGLNELRGRNVLYFEYRAQNSKYAFITGQDLVRLSQIDVRIYLQIIKYEKDKNEALQAVETLLSEFGAEITINRGPT